MADWLKVNHSLVRSAKIRGLMRALHCKKHAALGLAVSWLCWIDEQTTDGRTGLLPEELDDEIGFRGCAEALISIGWAVLGEDGCVEAVEFGKHCGDSAKERAENARRVAKCKANKKKKVMEESYQGNEISLPNALPEKNRIYNNKKGDGNATLCSERDASAPAGRVHPAPTDRGYGGWVRQVCAVLPQLAQMRTLPPDVDNAARVMYNTGYVPSAAELEALGRFWAAPARELRGLHRPTAFRWLMESLPEVCRTAQEWCDGEDRRLRKEAATARRKAQEAVSPAAGAPVTEEDKAAFFADVRGNSEKSGREGV